PYNTPNEPDLFYPGCPRNYARVVPTDELQGVVGAAFARQLGARRIYVLRDSVLYGQLLAENFAETARRISLQVVGGPEDTDAYAGNYDVLAQRVRQAIPDLVYWSGSRSDTGARLWRELRGALGDAVTLMGSDGIYSSSWLDAAGAA